MVSVYALVFNLSRNTQRVGALFSSKMIDLLTVIPSLARPRTLMASLHATLTAEKNCIAIKQHARCQELSSLRLPKSNLYAVRWRQNDLTFELSPTVLPVLAYTLKALKDPHNRITYMKPISSPLCFCFWEYEGKIWRTGTRTHLSQRELLSDADPRPAVERYVGPRFGRPLFPSFGAVLRCGWEVCRGWGVEVLASLHEQGRVADIGAFEDAW